MNDSEKINAVLEVITNDSGSADYLIQILVYLRDQNLSLTIKNFDTAAKAVSEEFDDDDNFDDCEIIKTRPWGDYNTFRAVNQFYVGKVFEIRSHRFGYRIFCGEIATTTFIGFTTGFGGGRTYVFDKYSYGECKGNFDDICYNGSESLKVYSKHSDE